MTDGGSRFTLLISRCRVLSTTMRATKLPFTFSSLLLLGVSQDTGVTMPGADIVTQNDLLIVGPGVLGRLVAEKWLKEHPGCKVFGQTASTDHHSELTDIGIIPSLKGSTISQKAPYVIFCAPPSRSDDYPGDLRKCMQSGRLKLERRRFFPVYVEYCSL
uniref:Uncharacterized protein n=1 Tax=Aegilops tauschii subsp. strangulata TaxID=200361 RepID=A0A453AAU0_AEGTS